MIAPIVDMADPDPRPADASDPPAIDAEPDAADESAEPSLQDWVEAENSRPTLPDETADGLDDMDEEVRHQAEDLPLDTPGRL